MKIEDIVKIILISTYKNLDEIAYEDDTEEIDCITKKDVSFFKEFINAYFLFLNKKEEFMKNIHDYSVNDKELAKNLNELEKKLIEMGKENFYKIDEQREIKFSNFLKIKPTVKIKKPEIKITSAKDSIYSLIWFYYEQILFNSKNIEEINKLLGYEFLITDLDKKDFKTFFNKVYEEYTNSNHEERSFIETLKILLKKYDMIAKVFKNGSENQVKRLSSINNCLVGEYEKINNYRNINMIDLFSGFNGYDNLSSIKYINQDLSKEDKALIEISDLNGMFSGLKPNEISHILYNYLQVYKNFDQIISKKEDFAFKDLSPLAQVINRTRENSLNKSAIIKLIDDFCSGKRSISFKEKEKTLSYN